MSELTITAVEAEVVYPLRRLILRPDKDFDFSRYPADHDTTTVHLGAYFDRELVGILSVYRESIPSRIDTAAWRFRDMGVVESMRGKKVGSALLNACLAHVSENHGALVWCYARRSAVSFYLARSFQVDASPVQLAGFGERFIMSRITPSTGETG